MASRRNLLVVARWPLGGIRTYMRHVYGKLGEGWNITIVASNSQENEALASDAREIGAELVVSRKSGKAALLVTLLKLLFSRDFDLIQSQGYISAVLASIANIVFVIPHIVTVHGVLEHHLLCGIKGRIRRAATVWAIRSSDVVYCVGKDMIANLHENISGLDGTRPRLVAIPNGLDTDGYSNDRTCGTFRSEHGFSDGLFLFGFLGRFMPQKGFDTLIDAVARLDGDPGTRDFKIVAMGTGDYQGWYMRMAKERKIEHRFCFLPFQRDVRSVYCALDAVVMPSRWEAYGLVAAEALCTGIPLIASDCIGLREVVADTPALVVPSEDPDSLAVAMSRLLGTDYRPVFDNYRRVALDKYDVRHTVAQLEMLFDDTVRRGSGGA